MLISAAVQQSFDAPDGEAKKGRAATVSALRLAVITQV
jgi:hypothetical protein